MTKEDILNIMRQNGDDGFDAIWANIADGHRARAAEAVRFAFDDIVPEHMRQDVQRSADKNPAKADRIFFESVLMALHNRQIPGNRIKAAAYRLGHELHQASLGIVVDELDKAADALLEEQKVAGVPRGEMVRRHGDSAIGRETIQEKVTEKRGFSSAKIPERRPYVMLMLPPVPPEDADPDVISNWSSSQVSMSFSIGFNHVKGRGPRDSEIMDAEVAFYNGREAVMSEAAAQARLDPEEPETEYAATFLLGSYGQPGKRDEARLGIFTTAYDQALMAWNPKQAAALAWSGADLVISDQVASALRRFEEEFGAGTSISAVAAADGSRRLADGQEPGLVWACNRAASLLVSRGLHLHEALLAAYFEGQVALRRLAGDPVADPASLWEEMISAPERFMSVNEERQVMP